MPRFSCSVPNTSYTYHLDEEVGVAMTWLPRGGLVTRSPPNCCAQCSFELHAGARIESWQAKCTQITLGGPIPALAPSSGEKVHSLPRLGRGHHRYTVAPNNVRFRTGLFVITMAVDPHRDFGSSGRPCDCEILRQSTTRSCNAVPHWQRTPSTENGTSVQF